ncbi:MAG: Gfo/Idh/MocA family oxidoreductase [Acidobacteria bacterium]|nr:Gfo/Idh/MocA family oxidoreductase [Acidobacteriota bacterium]
MKVAVVGVGHIGKEHARVVANTSGCELHAVVDQRRDRAQEVAERHRSRCFFDVSEIAGKVDAAVIAVPTEAHLPVAKRLLEAGVDCLVEKPIAGSIADADALIETAARCGRILQVGHVERFNPALQAALPLIKDPRFIEVHRLGSFVARSLDIDVVLDLMIHDIDVVLTLAGSMPTEVRAVGVPVLTRKIDICNVRLEIGKCVANLTASRVYRDKVRKVRIFQPDAYISLDYGAQSGDVYRLSKAEGLPQVTASALTIVHEEPFKLQLQAFMTAVSRRKVPACSGEEARRALQVALDIVQRAAVA